MHETAVASSNAEAEANRKIPLSPLKKIVFGSGALADGMGAAPLGYLFFYMTAVRGLSGTMAGLSFVIALLVDSVADPLIGSLSDQTRTRFGRRLPWMFAAALPMAIMTGLLFSAPATLKGPALFVWMTLAAIGTRVSFSLFTLPRIALGAELSDDYIERSSIMAYGIAFSLLASVAGPLLIFRVFTHDSNGLLRPSAYTPFAWVCASIGFAAAMGSTLGTRQMLPRLHVVETKARAPVSDFLRALRDAARHRHFVILFLGILIYSIAQGIVSQLNLHYAEFFWRFSNQLLVILSTVGAVGAVIGFPVTAWLQRYFDKHVLLVTTLWITCAVGAVFPLLRLINIVPASGPGLIVPNLVLTFLGGGAVILLNITFYSLLADAADEHEYLFHARREGLFFAALSFSSKAASALGAFIGGRALDLIGFPTAIGQTSAALHIPWHKVVALALIVGPGAQTLTASAALLVVFAKFSRADLLRVQESLSQRRASERTPHLLHAG